MYVCPCFQVGPVKYLSVTIFEDCSPEMLRDFYMDNDYRKQWDKMLIEHEQLHVDKNNGVEVGRTIKKFPLLTPREYVLAWRLWEGKDKTFYCFIKVIDAKRFSFTLTRKTFQCRFFFLGMWCRGGAPSLSFDSLDHVRTYLPQKSVTSYFVFEFL